MCGGLIHPIAGRCKHCKTDLSALRAARPAAMAPLPALHAHGNGAINSPKGTGSPASTNGHGSNGHAYPGHAAPLPVPYAPIPHAAAHAAVPMAMPRQDGSQPILPPRPTGRMYATSAPAGSVWWKSWPLVVIILAGLAIVAAVVLMVWPPGGASDKGVKNGALSPAPDRMDTNPLPPDQPQAHSGDPWNNGSGQKKPDPPAKIDIPDDPDPVDPDPSSGGATLRGQGAIVMAIMGRACQRAATCGSLDSALKDYCDMATKIPSSPPTCAAAKRCMDRIDEISCSAGFDDMAALQSATYKLQDCVEALSGC